MATETNTPALNHDEDNQRPMPAGAARDSALRNGRWSGYRHLLWARILELWREPEVVFWVFVFPLLLAAGLGIAFRNKPADVTSVVVIDGPGAQKTLAMLQSSNKGSDESSDKSSVKSSDKGSSDKRSPAHSTVRATV